MLTGLPVVDMATATERTAIGAEEARTEGKGPGGRAAEAVKNAATVRDQRVVSDGVHHDATHLNPDVEDRGLVDHHAGMLGHAEEEMTCLRNRTHITHEGEPYCPNPNIPDLVSEACAPKDMAKNRNLIRLCKVM